MATLEAITSKLLGIHNRQGNISYSATVEKNDWKISFQGHTIKIVDDSIALLQLLKLNPYLSNNHDPARTDSARLLGEYIETMGLKNVAVSASRQYLDDNCYTVIGVRADFFDGRNFYVSKFTPAVPGVEADTIVTLQENGVSTTMEFWHKQLRVQTYKLMNTDPIKNRDEIEKRQKFFALAGLSEEIVNLTIDHLEHTLKIVEEDRV